MTDPATVSDGEVTTLYTPFLMRHPSPPAESPCCGGSGSSGGSALSGHGVPDSSLGDPGDTYVDLDSNGLYWKGDDGWHP